MDAARLQAKVYAGYGKSAQRIGYAFTVYRPTTSSPAIAPGNIVGSPINATFTPRSSGFKFDITSDYTKPLFHGMFDATNVQVGDYLTAAGHGTYFVIEKPDQAPLLCVQCNNVVSIIRAASSSSPGKQPYMGVSPSTETTILSSWPASVIYDARGRSSGAQLPMDEMNPYFFVLLPALAGLDIRPSDIITDANSPARHYIVASSEKSPLGWRINAHYVVT